MSLSLTDLAVPLVAAPMAGGVSTPALAAASAAAGALGFLAAGYKAPDAVAEEIAATRALGAQIFGVNVFVPDAQDADLAAARAYREALEPLAQRWGVELPQPRPDDDAYAAKLALLLDVRPAAVSFTFGCPEPAVLRAFADAGILALVTVTSAAEARRAAEAGAAALVVQGPDAGGHRATFDARVAPHQQPLPELVAQVRGSVALPLVVTGGLTEPAAVQRWLDDAVVQVGTALLDAEEAGTGATYRAALRDDRFTGTALTRAFSGRFARGLENDFMRRFSAVAPASYPGVNQLTGPLRAAAARAGDADGLSLWAGTGWRAAPQGPAADIVAGLLR